MEPFVAERSHKVMTMGCHARVGSGGCIDRVVRVPHGVTSRRRLIERSGSGVQHRVDTGDTNGDRRLWGGAAGGDRMLSVPDLPRSAPGGPGTGTVDGLVVFVDRRGAAGTDRVAAQAYDQVRRAVDAGVAPPGLCRLAEGLSASGIGELPPAPRLPADDPGSVVAAVRDNPLLVLDCVEEHEVAAAVAALVDDGRRVIVTAAAGEALDAVRSALPQGVRPRVVDALPTLAPADLYRLRGLLATSTPRRRARAAQVLPDLSAFPDVREVAALCAVAVRPTP